MKGFKTGVGEDLTSLRNRIGRAYGKGQISYFQAEHLFRKIEELSETVQNMDMLKEGGNDSGLQK